MGTDRKVPCLFSVPPLCHAIFAKMAWHSGGTAKQIDEENHMKRKIQYIWLLLQTMLLSFWINITVWAGETEASDELIDFIKAGPGDRDPFEKATDMVKNTGASFYQLAMTVTVVVMIVCFIAAGLRYAWCKGQRREESKDNILAAFVGGGIAFAACSLVLLVKNIAGGLF